MGSLNLADYDSEGDQHMSDVSPGHMSDASVSSASDKLREYRESAILRCHRTDSANEDDDLMRRYGFSQRQRLASAGGHGMLISDDGSKVCKPTGEDELFWYESNEDNPGRYPHILKWLPKFYGVHTDTQGNMLSNRSSEKSGAVSDEELGIKRLTKTNSADQHTKAIVMENIHHGLYEPSLTCFDLKLGRRMYNERTADGPKREKMDKQTNGTTSGPLGVRVVWGKTAVEDMDTGSVNTVMTGKQYGRDVQPTRNTSTGRPTLQDAIDRFFPAPGDELTSAEDEPSPTPLRFNTSLEEYGNRDPKEIAHPSTVTDLSASRDTGPQLRYETDAGDFEVLKSSQDQDDGKIRLRRMKEFSALTEMIDVTEETESQLHDIKEDIKKTPVNFIGASLIITHALPEPGLTSSCGHSRRPSPLASVHEDSDCGMKSDVSTAAPSRSDYDRGTRPASPGLVSEQLKHKHRSRFCPTRSGTESNTSNVPSRSRLSSRPSGKRVVRVVLVDFDKFEEIPDPFNEKGEVVKYDTDAVDGIDTAINRLSTRRKELSSDRVKLGTEAELLSMTAALSDQSLEDCGGAGTSKDKQRRKSFGLESFAMNLHDLQIRPLSPTLSSGRRKSFGSHNTCDPHSIRSPSRTSTSPSHMPPAHMPRRQPRSRTSTGPRSSAGRVTSQFSSPLNSVTNSRDVSPTSYGTRLERSESDTVGWSDRTPYI